MATNIIKQPGYSIAVVCTHPTTPTTGLPVRYGVMTGLALTDEGEGGNIATETTVYFGPCVVDVSVAGVNGGGNSAVAVGDTIYYTDADTPVLNKKTTGYFFGFAMETVNAGATATIQVLKPASPGGGTLAAGGVTTTELAAGALSADASGRAIMATNYFSTAKLLDVVAADQITNAVLLQAVLDGAFVADAATRALFADAIWTEAKLATASLTGLVAAVVANANVIGGLTVLHRVDCADASANVDVVLTHKTRVIDAWALNTGIAAHAANDTWQVKNGANAISDAVAKTATVNAVKRVGTIDPAQAEIAAGGTLRITTVKDTNAAVTVYVLGIRVA